MHSEIYRALCGHFGAVEVHIGRLIGGNIFYWPQMPRRNCDVVDLPLKEECSVGPGITEIF